MINEYKYQIGDIVIYDKRDIIGIIIERRDLCQCNSYILKIIKGNWPYLIPLEVYEKGLKKI